MYQSLPQHALVSIKAVQFIQGEVLIMTRTKFRNSVVSVLPIVMLLLLGLFWANPVSAQETDGDGFVDGEVVVKLNKATGTTIQDVYSAYPEVDPTRTETFLTSSGIYLLRLTDSSQTEAVAGRMKNDTENLIYAEPNYTTDAPEGSRSMGFRGENTPEPSNPASYFGQYAVEALNTSDAHSVNNGLGSTVAVLDTGVELDHPELAASLVQGYDFIEDTNDTDGPADTPNGTDDDGDRYMDETTGKEMNVDEGTGHGTHVAGIVHLAAPEAKIMPLRVLDSDGTGNVFVIAEAIQYAAVGPDERPNSGDEADVINMSLSSSRESELLGDVTDDLGGDDDDGGEEGGDDDALEDVPQEGVVVVASAGNENSSKRQYPAAEEGALSVTSVGQDETKSDFASYDDELYASKSGWIDVAAPGDDIHSTFTEGRYAEWDGTSMAAPFVAGQAALIRSLEPTLPAAGPGDPDKPGPESVESAIKDNARSLNAKNPDYAGGLGSGHADACASVKDLRPETTCDVGSEPSTNTGPSISALRPTPGSATRDRTPVIGASVGDAETDLTENDVTLSFDGRPKAGFSYAASDDRIVYRSGRLSYGFHTVRISARDPEGLDSNEAWRFKVRR